MNRVPMTVLGEQSLREELERLKRVDRPRITQAIAEAREQSLDKVHVVFLESKSISPD